MAVERVHEFQVCVPSTERLDRFLADQLSLSRTQAARLIAAKNVRVNDELARASRTLDLGDRIHVRIPEEAAQPRVLQPHDAAVGVVFEDDALLVLDKPAGLVVHPAPGHWNDTLLNVLAARGTHLAGGGEGRPGIVHRLDKDTSGLMVLAKTEAVHRRIARALSERQVERIYAALAWGHLAQPMDVDAPIARNPRDRKRMVVLATGRPALTHVEAIARFDVCDLVRIRLATGRTHQIRVHLHHIGHPVVGDPVYSGGGHKRVTGAQQSRAQSIERLVPRQALHAARLSLVHPLTGDACVFSAEWPGDLRPVLAELMPDADLLARDNPLDYLGFFR